MTIDLTNPAHLAAIAKAAQQLAEHYHDKDSLIEYQAGSIKAAAEVIGCRLPFHRIERVLIRYGVNKATHEI